MRRYHQTAAGKETLHSLQNQRYYGIGDFKKLL